MSQTMDEKKAKWSKTARWIYWLITFLVLAPMLLSGGVLLSGVEANLEGLRQLGYPPYFAILLGTAKLLGGLAIVQPRFPTLKDWAYAGYSFVLISAAFSHAMVGDPVGKIIAPLIFLGLLLVSHRQWKTGWL